MTKLIHSIYNVDTNCVELTYSDGSFMTIDCEEVENFYGITTVQMADLCHLASQVLQPTAGLYSANMVAEYRNTGRVIAAVFQLAQTIEKKWCRRATSGKAYNSTHTFGPLG